MTSKVTSIDRRNEKEADYRFELMDIITTKDERRLRRIAYSKDPIKRLMAALNHNTPFDLLYFKLKDGPDKKVSIAAKQTVKMFREGYYIPTTERLKNLCNGDMSLSEVRNLLFKLRDEINANDEIKASIEMGPLLR